jgi:hypothetical protein
VDLVRLGSVISSLGQSHGETARQSLLEFGPRLSDRDQKGSPEMVGLHRWKNDGNIVGI